MDMMRVSLTIAQENMLNIAIAKELSAICDEQMAAQEPAAARRRIEITPPPRHAAPLQSSDDEEDWELPLQTQGSTDLLPSTFDPLATPCLWRLVAAGATVLLQCATSAVRRLLRPPQPLHSQPAASHPQVSICKSLLRPQV
jgi:hypothetical protein